MTRQHDERSGIIFWALLFGAVLASQANESYAQTLLDEWDTITAPPAPSLEAVTPDPTTTALLVMDFNQRICVPEERPRCAVAVSKVAGLIAHARTVGMAVIYTYGPNMEKSDFVPEIAPLPEDSSYQAPYNKFYGTDLETELRDAGITTVILTGTSAIGAVFATAAGAAERGFRVIVPFDTMASNDAYEEQFAAYYLVHGNFFRNKTVLTRSDMIGF